MTLDTIEHVAAGGRQEGSGPSNPSYHAPAEAAGLSPLGPDSGAAGSGPCPSAEPGNAAHAPSTAKAMAHGNLEAALGISRLRLWRGSNIRAARRTST